MSRDEQDFANLRFHVRSDRTIAAFVRRDGADNWARDRSYNFRCLCKVLRASDCLVLDVYNEGERLEVIQTVA